MKKELRRLAEGQERLTEGQARTDRQLERVAVLIGDFADRTAKSFGETNRSIDALADQGRRSSERLDKFGELVIRGFTDATGRDKSLEKRVDNLEQRVTDLER